MTNAKRSRVIRLVEIRGAIPGPDGQHSVSVLRHGTLDARLAVAPAGPAQQAAHVQDEVYVVARGRGVLFHDGSRDAFESGDLLFVAAGTEHRFEDFSEDLIVWVVFYGPEGGEVPA
jgi:mannose-6-phosphate isomerase-like protein (cupin superfamily)